MEAVTPFLEVTEAIKELGGQDLEKCMQCATCTGVCPWNLVKYFSPRGMIRLAQFGLEGGRYGTGFIHHDAHGTNDIYYLQTARTVNHAGVTGHTVPEVI